VYNPGIPAAHEEGSDVEDAGETSVPKAAPVSPPKAAVTKVKSIPDAFGITSSSDINLRGVGSLMGQILIIWN